MSEMSEGLSHAKQFLSCSRELRKKTFEYQENYACDVVKISMVQALKF